MLKVGRWRDRFCFCPPEYSVTGRLFNEEVRMTSEEFIGLVEAFVKEFPFDRKRIEEVLKNN